MGGEKLMAEDWAIDVRKYAPDADDGVIAAIVRYCGIALQSRDASLVSFTDPVETGRVRENYCKKKLGLTHSDEELDAAIARVGERMSGDTTRNRVTVYYLLAEAFGKLGLFGAAATATAAVAQPVAEMPPPPRPVSPVAPVVAAAAAAPLISTGAHASAGAPAREEEDDGVISTGMLALGLMGLIVLGTATAGSLIGEQIDKAPVAPMPAPIVPAPAPAAPAAVAPAIPMGSGVVAQDVAGKPQLSVYFDTAKADVSPDFAAAAAPVKAWIDSHPGDRLAVSGYNDPRGDAAFNAELSKNRAQSVAAALAALGVPAEVIDLEKPPETTDTSTSLENARRVDIIIKPTS